MARFVDLSCARTNDVADESANRCAVSVSVVLRFSTTFSHVNVHTCHVHFVPWRDLVFTHDSVIRQPRKVADLAATMWCRVANCCFMAYDWHRSCTNKHVHLPSYISQLSQFHFQCCLSNNLRSI